MIKYLYNCATFILSLAIFPLFLISPARRKNLSHRYGNWNLILSNCIWIHAASFGEVNALEPVVKLLREKYPDSKILITCTSNTGLEKAREIADYFFLAPFDNPVWIKRAFRRIKFNSLLISETELWPAMIEFALKREVPLYLINARISDYTFNNYKRIRKLITPLLNCFSKIICINKESEDRFRELGVYKELTEIAGYSKYDISPPSISEDKNPKKAQYFSLDQPVLTLGSIRPEEERVWFSAIKKAKERGLKFNLVVAPRHQEKFEYFERKLKEYGIEFRNFSDATGNKSESLLLDIMGKLKEIYTFSDAAFIGASLVDIGGHNPLEPVPSKCAVAIGPYYRNVRDVVGALENVSGIALIRNENDADNFIECLTERIEILKGQAERAFKFWQENFGASERIVKGISI